LAIFTFGGVFGLRMCRHFSSIPGRHRKISMICLQQSSPLGLASVGVGRGVCDGAGDCVHSQPPGAFVGSPSSSHGSRGVGVCAAPTASNQKRLMFRRVPHASWVESPSLPSLCCHVSRIGATGKALQRGQRADEAMFTRRKHALR
jgi:hypothetical protein